MLFWPGALPARRKTLLLNEKHKPWATGAILFTFFSSVGYGIYAGSALNGPTGGTLPGLIYGGLAYLMMFYCALLGVRRRLPAWSLGRMSGWLRGHIWIGLLTLPMVLFHGGFSVQGTLSTALIWLYGIVMVSGVLGLALQQALPRMMTHQIEMETIYEQIPHIIDQLRSEAEKLVEKACGPLDPEKRAKAEEAESNRFKSAEALRDFYERRIDGFITSERLPPEADLSIPARSHALFGHLRKLVPPEVQETVTKLEDICDERRQLELQIKLHHLLHGWLFLHTPLSLALLLLGATHALVSLVY